MAAHFAPVAKALAEGEEQIIRELGLAQGKPIELGGYYLPNDDLADRAMRPCALFNSIIDGLGVLVAG